MSDERRPLVVDEQLLSSVVTVAVAIIGLATIATLISPSSNPAKIVRTPEELAANKARGAAYWASLEAERKARARAEAWEQRATRTKKHPNPQGQAITILEAIHEAYPTGIFTSCKKQNFVSFL